MSTGKLETIFRVLKVPDCRVEYVFAKPRRWRFDYAWPERMVAIEYEGLFCKRSRHTTPKGFSNDREKYNEAQLMGWKVFSFTAIMVGDGRAYRQIEEIFK